MLRLRLLRLLFPVLLLLLGFLVWSNWNPRNRSHRGTRATDLTDTSQAQGVSVNRLTTDADSDLQIRQVKVFSRDPQRRQSFAQRTADALNVSVQATDSAEACVRGSDVLVVITNAREPALLGHWGPAHFFSHSCWRFFCRYRRSFARRFVVVGAPFLRKSRHAFGKLFK